MSLYLVAGLGAALRFADAGRPGLLLGLPANPFRDRLSSNTGPRHAILWLWRLLKVAIITTVHAALAPAGAKLKVVRLTAFAAG
jgi:hypothetical protein